MDPFAEEDGEKGLKEKNPAEEAMKYIVYVATSSLALLLSHFAI
jgi:hypothetical protein